MTTPVRERPSWLALALTTLALSAVAGLAVPPSAWIPGISDLERAIARVAVPSLVTAFVLALCGVAMARAGKGRFAGLFDVLALLLINLAGLLTGQYGVDGFGLLVTFPLSAPVAYIVARRETAWRRSAASKTAGGVPS